MVNLRRIASAAGLGIGVLCILTFPPAKAEDWTRFRGPNGQGRCASTDLPVTWSEHEGIVWKKPIPGRGWSSPVTRDNSVWLTTAAENGHSLRALCLAADTGKVRWDVEVFRPENPQHVNAKNTHASPSPIVEPGRLYVHFGAMGTACLDSLTGKVLWKNQDLIIDHGEGPGSSPILFEDLLIVNCDGTDRQFVVALAKQTGEAVWKTKRSISVDEKRFDMRKAFSTPAIIEVAGRPQVVSTGADQVEAYDPKTGKELWRVRYSGFSNVPIPIVDRDRVYVVTDFSRPALWAVRTDGQGDVTDSNVLWKMTRQIGASSSPVLAEERLYDVTDQGVLSCISPETGKPAWQHRVGGTFSASVLYLGQYVYLISEQGKTTVIRPGAKYEEVATNVLDGRTLATPAVCRRALLMRTDGYLYRIEATAGKTPTTASRGTESKNSLGTN
ncbi:MAG TPA: PQQ-binding-like beta-propeller repeat protein [Planctomycetaceae bacterium]|jgi:outer membrane protein assembly factor BamB|nr:PQQ-binding-like beta-propeller repeat protein [Planctomycetaceae bacterium]